MRVNLFDPGEGALTISVLDPNGTATLIHVVDAERPTTRVVAPVGREFRNDRVGLLTAVFAHVSGTGTQPFTGLNSTSKYNDRDMTLDIKLDDQYATKYKDAATGKVKTWWKIQYTFSGSPSDRTTWSASIVGDPVHLVN